MGRDGGISVSTQFGYRGFTTDLNQIKGPGVFEIDALFFSGVVNAGEDVGAEPISRVDSVLVRHVLQHELVQLHARVPIRRIAAFQRKQTTFYLSHVVLVVALVSLQKRSNILKFQLWDTLMSICFM